MININKSIGCPGCDRVAILIERNTIFFNRNHGRNYKISLDVLIYECECGESFTTTEIDTITFNRYNSKLRAIRRMERIECIR